MTTLAVSLQLLLLTAVKDVAHALQDVIEASTASSGREDSHPSTQQLKTSTKVRRIDSYPSARQLRTSTKVRRIDSYPSARQLRTSTKVLEC